MTGITTCVHAVSTCLCSSFIFGVKRGRNSKKLTIKFMCCHRHLSGEPLTKNHCDFLSQGDHSIDDMFSWYSSQTINKKVPLCVVNYLLQNHVVQ